MPTKSDVMYQRVLYVKQILKDIPIKHYDQARYVEIVDEIFDRNIGPGDEYGNQVTLCSDSSPCEYQTNEDGEPLADEVSGKESIVIEDDSVRGES